MFLGFDGLAEILVSAFPVFHEIVPLSLFKVHELTLGLASLVVVVLLEGLVVEPPFPGFNFLSLTGVVALFSVGYEVAILAVRLAAFIAPFKLNISILIGPHIHDARLREFLVCAFLRAPILGELIHL